MKPAMSNADRAVKLLQQANQLRVELQQAQGKQASIADQQRMNIKEAMLSRVEIELALLRPMAES